MNVAMIFRILGWMLMFEAAFMAPSGVVAAIYHEGDVVWLICSMGICLAAGSVMVLVSRPKNKRIYAREGSVICALVWFLYSIFGAFPFFLAGYITDFIDAVFETASGFTTTGASILSDVEALPYWQSIQTKDTVSATPVYTGTDGAVVTGSAQVVENVVGLMFDRDCMGMTILDRRVLSTPVNTKGLYRNLHVHAKQRVVFDSTEKCALLLLD